MTDLPEQMKWMLWSQAIVADAVYVYPYVCFAKNSSSWEHELFSGEIHALILCQAYFAVKVTVQYPYNEKDKWYRPFLLRGSEFGLRKLVQIASQKY